MLQALLKPLLVVCLLSITLDPFVFSQQEPATNSTHIVPPIVCQGFKPVCSTEKVNGDCYVNVDRRYPISMPILKLLPDKHVTVCVFHTFPFETLTLDPGPASAYEGTDQAAALVASMISFGKGAVVGISNYSTLNSAVQAEDQGSANFNAYVALHDYSQITPIDQKQKLKQDINKNMMQLNEILTDAINPVSQYFKDTTAIYALIREIESALPRPVADVKNTELLPLGVPGDRKNPWLDYSDWKIQTLSRLRAQGLATTELWNYLPIPCQKKPLKTIQPWVPTQRACSDATAPNTIPQPPDAPLEIPASYEPILANLQKDADELSRLVAPCSSDQKSPPPDCKDYLDLSKAISALGLRHERISSALSDAENLLPGMIPKITTDMETLYENIQLTPDANTIDPVVVGVIPGPKSGGQPTVVEKQALGTYKALAPQISYTLNEQNQIANSLLGLPSATQKQSIVTVSAVYAAPRFEGSAGAFFSWLPNRTFSNVTNVTVVGGVPAPTSIQIEMTKTTPPLVIPYAAANYRISREYTWLGGRRGATYLTLGVALNAYDTQVEYAGGFSFSWRSLMISPLYHLGHGIHLTDGETVGQTWCVYGNGATATSTPPLCTGPPPAPSTKTFWTGQFAIGISVRLPTTFTSTNQ